MVLGAIWIICHLQPQETPGEMSLQKISLNIHGSLFVYKSAALADYFSAEEENSPHQWVSCIWHETASNGEASVLELRGMLSTLSLPVIPGPLQPGVPSIGQIELIIYLCVNGWYWIVNAA